MTPRPSKPTGPEITPPPEVGTPKIISGVQGHDFGMQFGFDVNRQLGKLEAGLANVEAKLARVEAKIDKIEENVAAINSKIDFIKPIAKSIGKGIWAIVLLLVTFALTMLGYWLKHHYGW